MADALKAAAFTAATVYAFNFVGLEITPALADAFGKGTAAFAAAKGLVHGALGGALSAAQGRNFLEGFASAGFAASAGVFTNGIAGDNVALDTAIVAAVGCAGALLGGGKCANGAATAAFANIYNKWSAKLDAIQTSLDIAGLAPGVGNGADLLNAGISLLRGDWWGAAERLASALPGVGQGVTATRLARVSKNSKDYVGDTHAYVIKGPDGVSFKVGETATGFQKTTGVLKRAAAQINQLRRHGKPGFESRVLNGGRPFPTKAAARAYETKVITRYRRMYGQDALKGNKGVH